jgi:hypothetical protein
MQKYLDANVVFPTDGPTDFGSAQANLTYTDVGDQSSEFRDTLKNLIKYGMLTSRPKFE